MALENKLGDWIKGGLDLFKKDPVSWIIVVLVGGIASSCSFGILSGQIGANMLKMAREFKNNGTKPEVGGLFKFDNVVQYFIAMLIVGVASMCFVGILLIWTLPLMAFKNMQAMDAIKAAWAYSMKNLVPTLIFAIVIGIVAQIGGIALGLGALITAPIALFAFLLGWETIENEIGAAA